MYGQTFEAPSFKAGINEFDKVKFLGYVAIETEKYVGGALDLVLANGDAEYSQRWFPIDESRITPRERRDRDGNTTMPTQEEAIKQEYKKFNSVIKHIFTNFMSEEDFHSVEGSDFKAYIEALQAKLPADYTDSKGEFILGYNNNGYLEMPRQMWITGDFLNVNGQKPLTVSDRVKLSNVEQVKAQTPKNVTW